MGLSISIVNFKTAERPCSFEAMLYDFVRSSHKCLNKLVHESFGLHVLQ